MPTLATGPRRSRADAAGLRHPADRSSASRAQLSQDAVVAQLTTVFSGISLLLACLGLYGTISYGVNQRVAELGLRIALGADRRQVLWLVMREALVLVAVGSVVGFCAGLPRGARPGHGALRHRSSRPAGLRHRRGAALERRPVAAYLPAFRASRSSRCERSREDSVNETDRREHDLRSASRERRDPRDPRPVRAREPRDPRPVKLISDPRYRLDRLPVAGR